MTKVVEMLFQQIMTELSGVESQEDRDFIKTQEAKWLLEFIGPSNS
jgi:hypothetical protein